MSRLRPAAAASLISVCLALPAAVVAQDLQPHRAVYDVSLAEVQPSASIASASGRLVFELSGDACEGYVVNSRFVTRVSDREGSSRVTDLRSSTFETLEPATFTFLNQTYVNDVLASEVKGKAEGRAGGVMVTLTEPKDTGISLGRAVFPTAHTLLMIEAASEGERVLEATIFDGGENADTLFETTTFIGEGESGLPGAAKTEAEALSALPDADESTTWRLSISYFEKNGGDGGEQVPDYELTFTMLKNGISYDIRFDYGTFAMTGELVELELMEAPEGDC